MSKKFGTGINLLGSAIENVRLESLSSPPSSPQPGQVWFDAILGKFVFRGASANIDPTARGAHTGQQLAETVSDLAPTVKAYKLHEFAPPDESVDFNAQKITGLAVGTDPTDALAVSQLLAFGETVDSWLEDIIKTISQFGSSLQLMPAAAAVAASNITLHGEPPLLDGVQTQVGQWILLTAQADTAENGPWFLTGSTQENPEDEPTPAVWIRQREELLPQELQAYAGAIMPVALGDAYAGTLWIHANDTYIDTVGTLALGGIWKVVGADRALHTGQQLASTISNLAATVQAYRLNQFAAPNGTLDLNAQVIADLGDVNFSDAEAAETQAVNLRSARALIAGGNKYKLSADYVAENFISAAIFAGTEDYYTDLGGGVAPGSTVLATAQSNESENGLWIAGGGGDPWTRVPAVTLSPGEAVYVVSDKSVWQYVGVNVVAPADVGTAYQLWRPFLNTALGRALYKKSVDFVAITPVDTSLTVPQTIDGAQITSGRILLTHQSGTYDNGLWRVSTTFVNGDPVTSWSRVDAVQSGYFEGIGAQLGETVFVLQGVHQGETWRLNSTNNGEIWRNTVDEALFRHSAYVSVGQHDLLNTSPFDVVPPEVTLAEGDLILLANQVDVAENGLYAVVFESGWNKVYEPYEAGQVVFDRGRESTWMRHADNTWWQNPSRSFVTDAITDYDGTIRQFVITALGSNTVNDQAYADDAVAAQSALDRAYTNAQDVANSAADQAYTDAAKADLLGILGATVAPMQGAVLIRPTARVATNVNTTLHTLPPVLDGVQVDTADWVLLLGQTNPNENGLWYIPDAEDDSEIPNGNALTWRRTRTPTPGVVQDFPLINGSFVEVHEGTYGGAFLNLTSGLYGGIVDDNNEPQTWQVINGARSLHRGTQLASTISNFDTQVRTSRLDQLAVPDNDVSLDSHKLVDVTPGTAGTDAVNVDQLTGVDTGVRAYADGLDAATRTYADGLSTADRAYTDTAVAGVADNRLSDFLPPDEDLSMGTQKIIDLVAGTAPTDAVNLSQLTALVAGSDSRTLDQIPDAADDVNLAGFRITNLGAPEAPSDAVNRAFVESLANGIDWKQSVRAKSTGDIAVLAGTMSLDGVTLDPGDRVLLANQADPTLNGIWVVTENTSPVTPWTRAADASQGTLSASSAVMVEEGSTFGDSQWRLLTNDDIVVGTTALTWTQIGAAVSYVNGAGLDLTGNVFSLMANVPRKFSAAVGDGVQTSFTVNHNLGTRDVTISVYYDADGVEVECDVARTGINSIALGFAAPPDSASLRCVVVG